MRTAAPVSLGVAAVLRAGVANAARIAATLGMLALGIVPAQASYDQEFVDAFAAACVPERLSYEGTRATALKEGWREVAPAAHPELAAILEISEREAAATTDLQSPEIAYATYEKSIEGVAHYLLVSRTSAEIGEPDDPPDPWAFIGCYLYNFEAAAAIDPEVVSALIGNPIANSQVDMHINGWVWGPPCPMPRTGDTYLTFLPEVSQYTAQTGFSGLVLKFDTSEPDAGDPAPEPYC